MKNADVDSAAVAVILIKFYDRYRINRVVI
jgi:hypothetical protein